LRSLRQMSLRKQSRRERRRYQSPQDWPSWTDDVRFVPSDADVAWASQNLNDGVGHADVNPPDSYYDDLAEQAEHQDRLERGCL
jgi:hypothetical protein